MFQFVLGIKMSFVLVGAGHVPRRCAATHSENLTGWLSFHEMCPLTDLCLQKVTAWYLSGRVTYVQRLLCRTKPKSVFSFEVSHTAKSLTELTVEFLYWCLNQQSYVFKKLGTNLVISIVTSIGYSPDGHKIQMNAKPLSETVWLVFYYFCRQ